MSAIFGEVRFDGGPPGQSRLSAMAEALGDWGRGGILLQTGPSAGMGVCFGKTQQVRRAEAADEGGALCFVASARLDDRHGLAKSLAISGEALRQLDDNELVRQAYLRWGEECTHRLLGDWSFAAWHPEYRRLILARDQLGITALFYHLDDELHPKRILFAPSRSALQAAGVETRLNEIYLARTILSVHSGQANSTIDRNIHRLPPAHILRSEPSGIHTRSYWQPIDRPQSHRMQLAEAVEGFLSIYQQAVQDRCTGNEKIAVTLSGGLDSGSVASLAARAVLQPARQLLALTHIPMHVADASVTLDRFADESALARATAQFAGISNHRLTSSAHTTPLLGIEHYLRTHGAPAHAASNAFWMHDLLSCAAASGATTLLTGQGGNATISWCGAPAYDSWWSLIRAGGASALLRHALPLRIFQQVRLRRARRHLFRHTAINPDWISKLLADGAGEAFEFSQRLPRPSAMAGLALRKGILRPGASPTGERWALWGAAHGLSVRDPTCDTRVVDYVFSLPDTVFRGQQGLDRMLIRSAMVGLLPDCVRLNAKRGRQSADLVMRLRNDRVGMEQALASLEHSHAAEFVSVPRLREVWSDVQQRADPETTHRAGAILLRGLCAALWVNRQ